MTDRISLNFKNITLTSVVLVCFAMRLSMVVAQSSDNASPAQRPNIVVLFADDLGYGELGCQGNPEIPTPHIDSIAGEGVRFTAGYVTGPNCSPSRAGLLTGRTPTRFGYEFNPTGARNEEPGFGLPPEEVTIAEALHDAGYTTGLIGKWHQGGAAKYHPFRHGFDEFFGFTHEGHYFVPPPYKGVTTMLRRKTLPDGGKGRWIGKKGLIYSTHMGYDEPDYDANNPIVRGGQPVVENEYLTDALTREAVDFIDRHDDKPFFLLLAYNAVHSPLQDAATVVMFCTGHKGHVLNPHLDEFDKLMKAGTGVVMIHWATEAEKGKPGDKFLEWMGGFCDLDWSVNPHWTPNFKDFPDHPIANEVKPFRVDDEWYYHMRFVKDMKGVTPILSDLPPTETLRRPDGPRSGNPAVRKAVAAGKKQVVAWAYDRPTGGRGFGFTGAHNHVSWQDENFRKVVLNAILWTAKVDVPKDGCPSLAVSDARIKENLDDKKRKKK